MVRIAVTKLCEDWGEFDYHRALSRIDKRKRLRLVRFKQVKDLQRGIIGEWLLRYMLESIKNITSYEVEYNPKGKPFLKNMDHLYFNISHAQDYVLCGLSNYPIGVDVEQVSYHYSKYGGIEQYVFGEQERKVLDSLKFPHNAEYFFGIWTQKEAFAKCVGEGMGLYDEFSFNLPSENKIFFQGIYYYFQEIYIEEGYKSHVCCTCEQVPKVQMLTMKELFPGWKGL